MGFLHPRREVYKTTFLQFLSWRLIVLYVQFYWHITEVLTHFITTTWGIIVFEILLIIAINVSIYVKFCGDKVIHSANEVLYNPQKMLGVS